MRKPTKLKKKSKKMILQLADFIGDLKKKKLDMGTIADLNDSEEMNPKKCNSAGCVMGWAPLVLPGLEYCGVGDILDIQIVEKKAAPSRAVRTFALLPPPRITNVDAMIKVLAIPEEDADWLFSSGTKYYQTPKQVSKGLREYVKEGLVPRRCFYTKIDYNDYLNID